ncbi:MAG: redoxin domain-containing protein [Dehalococcoidia bacterium]
MTAFRTHTDAFTKANAQVLGISIDSFAAAGEFQEKLGLEFPLAGDWPKYQAGRDYGVFNEQASIHNRTTVVIDKDGIVRDIYVEARDFDSHPVKALEALKSMGEAVD